MVTIVHLKEDKWDDATTWEVVRCENGFQGWVVLGGLTREQADDLAMHLVRLIAPRMRAALTAEHQRRLAEYEEARAEHGDRVDQWIADAKIRYHQNQKELECRIPRTAAGLTVR
jgi:hypothetical protein